MKHARRITLILAAVTAVVLLLALAVGAWAGSGGGGATMLYVAGADDAEIVLQLAVVWSLLLVATLLSAACWVALGGTMLRRWLGALLGVLAVASAIPLGLVCFGLALGGTGGRYTPFEAPDGTRYLLQVDNHESGKLAVYQSLGYGRWSVLPSFGVRYGLPGSPPCRPEATDTRIVVRCTGGDPSDARR